MQDRHTEYAAVDSSYGNNLTRLVGTPPGLYAGFDAVLGATMSLMLHHANTGFIETKIDGTLAPKAGVLLSRQGVTIIEPDSFSIPIEPVTTRRYDLLVCTHAYVETQDGQAATYSVITAGYNPNIGIIALSPHQIPLGILDLPAGCTALNQTGVIYQKITIPNLSALNVAISQKYDINGDTYYELPNADYGTGWGYAFQSHKFKVRKNQLGEITIKGRLKASAGAASLLLTISESLYQVPDQNFVTFALRYNAGTGQTNPIPITIKTYPDGRLEIDSGYVPVADDEIIFTGITFPQF